MADLTNIKLKTVTLQDITDEVAESKIPTTTSKITNDANYVLISGKINSAVTANKAAKVTNKSGVTAGSYGPTANVTIGKTERKSIVIPQFTVNAQGLVTSATNRTYIVANACSNCSQCDRCSQCKVTSGCNQCTDCNQTTCRYNECSDCGHCDRFP